jgi:hypothetical protein
MQLATIEAPADRVTAVVVETAVAGMSAPLEDVLNFCTIACGRIRWVSPIFVTV